MESFKYMFINYGKDFPAHLSVQSGRKHLVAPHYHEDAEIFTVSEGGVSVQAGTEIIKCYKGDILVLYPNTLHQVKSLTEDAKISALL
ncbi:MAG: cupin domain-containing protein, partial [Clostridia bacterium]|nr:cupin domain-containing protein [Clostridia bacterium]